MILDIYQGNSYGKNYNFVNSIKINLSLLKQLD